MEVLLLVHHAPKTVRNAGHLQLNVTAHQLGDLKDWTTVSGKLEEERPGGRNEHDRKKRGQYRCDQAGLLFTASFSLQTSLGHGNAKFIFSHKLPSKVLCCLVLGRQLFLRAEFTDEQVKQHIGTDKNGKGSNNPYLPHV